jgi:hypothetical protein
MNVINIDLKPTERHRTGQLLTILRSIMLQPSAHNNVGKVSKPSDRHRLSMSLIPFWHSGVSDSVKSPVAFVYARRSMIHQNPESTGATLPMALSPKSACRVSTPFFASCSTLKLAGMAPSPSLNRSTFFSQACSSKVFNRKFLTISGSPFIRNAIALGTKSLTNTCRHVMSPAQNGSAQNNRHINYKLGSRGI